MKYQKIINLLRNTPNQPSKFRTTKWVEVNDSCRRCDTNSQIKFKTSMLQSKDNAKDLDVAMPLLSII